jgi:cyanophycinase-like exopeptidase
MNTSIALIGGETFTPDFESTHRELIGLARSLRVDPDDRPVQAVYLVTCASHDGIERMDYLRHRAQLKLGEMGVNVLTPPVIDHSSANDPQYARVISEADWIYFSGGHPHIGMQILQDSLVLDAIMTAAKRGVLISGSSAGAMILCSHSVVITPEMRTAADRMIKAGQGHADWQFAHPPIVKCLDLVPKSMCWPHMNRLFSLNWSRQLLPDGHRLIGIDEQTAAVKDISGRWQVWGKGKVVVATDSLQQDYVSGMDIEF